MKKIVIMSMFMMTLQRMVMMNMMMMLELQQNDLLLSLLIMLLMMEDDQDDSRIPLLLSLRQYSTRNNRSRWFFNDVIPNMTDREFKCNFRMRRSTFNLLVGSLQVSWDHFNTRVNYMHRISCQLALLIFLWRIANTTTYREIGNVFSIHRSTAHRICHRVCKLIVHKHHNLISLPKTSATWQAQRSQWSARSTFPGVVGAIDGSHIPLAVAPRDNKVEYYNRKQFYSVVLQGLVNADQCFLHVTVGMPGSNHDSTVLKNSPVWTKVPTAIPIGHFIVGDSAYPVQPWLMTPFKHINQIDSHHLAFNKSLSQARVNVEITFGKLKSRWRALRKLYYYDGTDRQYSILAACILHNYCELQNDLVLSKWIVANDQWQYYIHLNHPLYPYINIPDLMQLQQATIQQIQQQHIQQRNLPLYRQLRLSDDVIRTLTDYHKDQTSITDRARHDASIALRNAIKLNMF